jgi:polar amino acid transport system substrate-binding protein
MVLAAVASMVVFVTSCGGADSTQAVNSGASSLPNAFTSIAPTKAAGECGPSSGKTLRSGVLTIATDDPPYPPWFLDGDPGNGRGFEGAVAQEIWGRMGYARDKVAFTKIAFADALKPGDKPFDFDIDQFTIEDTRRAAVDFSSPYYAVAQSVVALAKNPAAQATTLAALSQFRLGAESGSTSLAAIVGTLHPTIPPAEFASNDDAKKALEEGRVDALVVDLPTGFQIAGNQVRDGVLVGQFPRPNDVTEYFGVVLQKSSRLTPCVSATIDGLYTDGTLDDLAKKWLADSNGARVLE